MKDSCRTYIAIDLKSFYASVECVERGLDPLSTHLVVADESRTEKTICLAVSPSLKKYRLGGRPRLFEVIQHVHQVNRARKNTLGNQHFTGKSYNAQDLDTHPELEVDFIRAVPRMALYIKYSVRIYQIYLKYLAPEDIHIYSIDEVFMDVTNYLSLYKMDAHQLAMTIIRDVLQQTGITATAGIGTNLYLAKVAMDIVAKHVSADKDGVRIAELDEMSYRQELWDYRPLTAFWRVGHGIAHKLEMYGIDTMGKLARFSLEHETTLYHLFGVNAELLIDHAWGWEPCTMKEIKSYQPEAKSMGSGQVLNMPYTSDKARIVIQEMAEALALDLFAKHLVTDQLVMTIGYDRESLSNPDIASEYQGDISIDYYGRRVPRHAHGSEHLSAPTSSLHAITEAATTLFDKIINPRLLIRRLNLVAAHVMYESYVQQSTPVQLDLFVDYEKEQKQREEKEKQREKERRMQNTIIQLKERFGKNAILRGLSFKDGATARERNRQIGGHKA